MNNIVFPIYNADGSPFHDLVLKKTSVESVVMSLSDKISGDVYYKDDSLVFTMREYIEYNGVRYTLVSPPTIVREGLVADNSELKGTTKYSFVFYHPMVSLTNIPFTDIAVSPQEEVYLSQDKTFNWIGTLDDFVEKIAKNLESTQWEVHSNVSTAGDTALINKANKLSEVMTFENSFISNALQRAYDTWEIPFTIDKIDHDYSGYHVKYSDDGSTFTPAAWDELQRLSLLPREGRNLILKSDEAVQNSSYLTKTYYLGELKPQAGDTITITIKGTLGGDREKFMVYNSGSYLRLVNLGSSQYDSENGWWTTTFEWKTRHGGSDVANTYIRVYAAPSNGTSTSSIEWIKLEYGSARTEFSLAPEDYLVGTTIGKYVGKTRVKPAQPNPPLNFNSYSWSIDKRFDIVFGTPYNAIFDGQGNEFVFQFGQGVGLKNNSVTPRNNKIVTRIVGYGSEDNIPYGYPQIIWSGNQDWEYTINNDPTDPHSYPIYDGIVNGQNVRLIKHPFTRKTLMPSIFAETVNKKVNPRNSNYNPDIEIVDYIDAIGSDYPNNIDPTNPSVEYHQFDVKPQLNDTSLVGVMPYNDGNNYDFMLLSTFRAQLLTDVQRSVYEMERSVLTEIYNLLGSTSSISIERSGGDLVYTYNYKIKSDANYYYVTYKSTGFSYNVAAQRYGNTLVVIWDDTLDDDGTLIQSYFKVTLPQLDFDLYACASATQEMTINMRSGDCLGCNFDVQVDWDDYKANFYDSNGQFAPNGQQRDLTKYPNSANGQITLIVQKDISTFGTVMPNTYQQPKSGDKFVFLGISLPYTYVTNAQTRLDGEMADYMKENNVHYKDYPLKFDPHFLATHEAILEQIRPSVSINFLYNGEIITLSVKQMSIRYGENILPQYDITLTDNIDVVINPIGQAMVELNHARAEIQALWRTYKNDYDVTSKLSRINDDVALGLIKFQKGIKVGVSGSFGQDGVLRAVEILSSFGDFSFKKGGDATIGKDLTAKGNLVVGVNGAQTGGNGTFYGNIQAQNATINQDINTGRAIVIGDYQAGSVAMGGAIIYADSVTGFSHAIVDYLNVKGQMHVTELVVDKAKAVGGTLVVSPASGIIESVVPLNANGEEAQGNDTITRYRCYLSHDDGANVSSELTWEVGDLAYCKTYGIKEGTTYNYQSRNYWREVLEVAQVKDEDNNVIGYYLELDATVNGMSTQGFDVVPASGDNISVLGHKPQPKPERMRTGTLYLGDGTPVERSTTESTYGKKIITSNCVIEGDNNKSMFINTSNIFYVKGNITYKVTSPLGGLQSISVQARKQNADTATVYLNGVELTTELTYIPLTVTNGEAEILITKSTSTSQSVVIDRVMALSSYEGRDRMNAIVISAYGDDSPSEYDYEGIDGFNTLNLNHCVFAKYWNVVTQSYNLQVGKTINGVFLGFLWDGTKLSLRGDLTTSSGKFVDTIATDLETLQGTVNDAIDDIEDIASDSVVTGGSEKRSFRETWDTMYSEYLILLDYRAKLQITKTASMTQQMQDDIDDLNTDLDDKQEDYVDAFEALGGDLNANQSYVLSPYYLPIDIDDDHLGYDKTLPQNYYTHWESLLQARATYTQALNDAAMVMQEIHDELTGIAASEDAQSKDEAQWQNTLEALRKKTTQFRSNASQSFRPTNYYEGDTWFVDVSEDLALRLNGQDVGVTTNVKGLTLVCVTGGSAVHASFTSTDWAILNGSYVTSSITQSATQILATVSSTYVPKEGLQTTIKNAGFSTTDEIAQEYATKTTTDAITGEVQTLAGEVAVSASHISIGLTESHTEGNDNLLGHAKLTSKTDDFNLTDGYPSSEDDSKWLAYANTTTTGFNPMSAISNYVSGQGYTDDGLTPLVIDMENANFTVGSGYPYLDIRQRGNVTKLERTDANTFTLSVFVKRVTDGTNKQIGLFSGRIDTTTDRPTLVNFGCDSDAARPLDGETSDTYYSYKMFNIVKKDVWVRIWATFTVTSYEKKRFQFRFFTQSGGGDNGNKYLFTRAKLEMGGSPTVWLEGENINSHLQDTGIDIEQGTIHLHGGNVLIDNDVAVGGFIYNKKKEINIGTDTTGVICQADFNPFGWGFVDAYIEDVALSPVNVPEYKKPYPQPVFFAKFPNLGANVEFVGNVDNTTWPYINVFLPFACSIKARNYAQVKRVYQIANAISNDVVINANNTLQVSLNTTSSIRQSTMKGWGDGMTQKTFDVDSTYLYDMMINGESNALQYVGSRIILANKNTNVYICLWGVRGYKTWITTTTPYVVYVREYDPWNRRVLDYKITSSDSNALYKWYSRSRAIAKVEEYKGAFFDDNETMSNSPITFLLSGVGQQEVSAQIECMYPYSDNEFSQYSTQVNYFELWPYDNIPSGYDYTHAIGEDSQRSAWNYMPTIEVGEFMSLVCKTVDGEVFWEIESNSDIS